jgi:glutamate transport system permease protein
MSTVLYDEPGPRTIRRIRIFSMAAIAALAFVAWLAAARFADNGQFEGARWQVVVDSARYLAGGLWITVRMAVVAVIAATLFGLALAVGRVAPNRALRWLFGGWVEFFRAIPLLALVVFAFVGLPKYGVTLPRFWCVVVGLIFYNSAALCEVFRAGINSVERGQREAASSIGLRWWQSMRIVVLPQGVRRMLPAYISQMVTIIKDTSLGFVVGAEELLSRSRQIGVSNRPSLVASFIVVLAVYLVINVTLSRAAVAVERRTTPSRPGR